MTITYETLQQVFAQVQTRVANYAGFSPHFAYENEVSQFSHLPPRSIVVVPQGFRYEGAVRHRGDGRKCLKTQVHSFVAVMWGESEDDAWALEAAFSVALLEIAWTSARPLKGGWEAAANSRFGRALMLEFEIDVPLLAPAGFTVIVESAVPTASS